MKKRITLMLVMGFVLIFSALGFAQISSPDNNEKKEVTAGQANTSDVKVDEVPSSAEVIQKNAVDADKEQKSQEVIKESFKYTIMTENFPPFNYESKGHVTGIATEIVREMFGRLGMENIPIKVMSWDKAYSITLKKPDTIIFSLTKIAERENKFKWVGPIATNYWYLFTVKQPLENGKIADFIKVNRLSEAEKYKIGVQAQGAISQYLESKGFTNLVKSKTNEQSALNLLDGKVQLWGESELAAASLLRQLKKNPNILKKVFKLRRHNLYIGFNIKTPDSTIEEFQTTLNQMKNDGSYDKIVNKYYNELYLETIKEGEQENIHPKKYSKNN